MANTAVTIRNITFSNPVLTASGTFGYGLECPQLTDVAQLGAVVTKSISRKPRHGNPPQRIAEASAGMLNSIGLANVGADVFLNEKLPALRQTGATVIVNIAASTIDEYCDVLQMCDDQDGVAGYEINVSCPNVKDGGLSFGTNCASVAEITRRTRALTDKFLAIKLTPNVTSVAEFARACQGEGADAVTCCNTFLGLAVNIRTRTPKIATVTGGYSGPAVKPLVLAKIWEVRKAVDIPVIGSGGIMTTEDAIEFLIVGATLVEVGTALFIDPDAGVKIAQGIAEYMDHNGIATVGELTGSLQTGSVQPVSAGW